MGRESGGDEGFTLVETLMALTLVIITMASAGPFLIGSLQAAARQRNEQYAVQLANAGIEQVRALQGSSLITGRGPAAVQAQWNGAPAIVRPYLDQLFPAADLAPTSAALGEDAAIPTSAQTITVDGNDFTRSIYVGACDVHVEGDCVGYDPAATNLPDWLGTTDDLQFYRAVVHVSWTDKNCAGNTCDYVTSTLVSRGTEPTFDVHRPSPLIKDQTIYFYKGTVEESYQLEASGGQLPNRWQLTGTPPVASVTPAGVVTSNPAANVGEYQATATVTDSLSRSNVHPVKIVVLLPPSISGPASLVAHVGDTVSQQVSASGGLAPLTYAAPDGLPDGLLLDENTGAITGVPTTVAPATPVTITVTDKNKKSATSSVPFTIHPALTLAAIADQTLTLGQPVSATAVAGGGDGTYTFTATGLPAGVLLGANDGQLTGVATVPGRYLPTVTVTDGAGGTAQRTFVLLITTTTGLAFTSPDPLDPDQTSPAGKNVNLKVVDNGSALGLNPVVTAVGLPPGLSVNSGSGNIGGKPTTPGAYLVTLTSTNVLPPRTAVLTFLWTIT